MDNVPLWLVAGAVILWVVWALILWAGLLSAAKPEPPPERDTDGADWTEGDKHETR